MTMARRNQATTMLQRTEHGSSEEPVDIPLKWVRASYHFHTFCYRDPRSAFSSALGIPVVSPTTVLLGVASTLFNLGKADEARGFIRNAHLCRVAVDPPSGAVFFRA